VASESLVKTLRAEIDRKHQEAVKALETLSAYLSDAQLKDALPSDPVARIVSAKPEKVRSSPRGSKVARVLSAISSEPKTARQVADELGMKIQHVRAVLYSNSVKKHISKKQVGNLITFCQKHHTVSDKSANGEEITTASLVRDVLAKHPNGLTPTEIRAEIADALAKSGGTENTVGSALYNMKKKGKLAHDVSSGTYRLVGALN
jgi:hypothetical protein